MPDDSDASFSPDPDSSDFHDISGYDIEEAITPLVLPDPSTLPPDISPDEALSSVQKWAGMPIGLGGMGDGGVSSTDSGRAIYDPTVKPNEYAEVGSSGLVQYGGFVRDEFLPQLQGDRGIKTLREMYDNDAVVGAVIFAIQMLMRAVNWHVDPPEAPTVEEIVQDRIAERKRLADQHRAAVMQDIMIARGTQEAGLGGTDGNPTPSTSTSPKPASKPGSGSSSSSPAKKSRLVTLLHKSLHPFTPLSKAASTTHGPMAPALSPPMTLPPGMANLDPSSAVDPETGVPLSQTYTPTPEEIHAEELAVWIESCLWDMEDSWADLISQIATLIVFGFAFHELVYKKRSGFNDDPMKSSLYDDGKIGWAAIAGRAQETVHRWEFNDAGHVIGMWQLAPPKYKLRYIPLSKALLFRTTGFKGNPQGRSILRSAYKSWYYLKRIQEYEAIGVERDLAGLPIAYVPYEWFTPGALPSEKAALEEVKRIVRNLRRNEQEGVVFPNAYDENHNKLYELNLLASPSKRNFDTNVIITRYEQRIAMTALADFILLGHEHGGGGGVKGIGQGKIDMFTTALEAWLNSIADVFNNQAIPRLMRMNGEDPALSPKLVFEKIGKTSLTDIGAIITAMAGAGADLFPDGALESWVREQSGMPAKTANNAL